MPWLPGGPPDGADLTRWRVARALGILAGMAIRRSFAPWLALASVLALAACDIGGGPSGPASAAASAIASAEACSPAEVEEGGIAGRVVGPDGEPVDDVLILIETPGGFSGRTRTGEDGVFTAPGVSGEFEISTTDIAYRDAARVVTVPCGELVEVEIELTPVE